MSELKPVGWQFYQDGKWHTGMNTNNHEQNTAEDGYPIRHLYTTSDVEALEAKVVEQARQVAELERELQNTSEVARANNHLRKKQRRELDDATKRGGEIQAELCRTEAKLASVALTGSPFDEEALAKRDLEQQIQALDKLEDGLTWSSDMGCLVVTSEYIADRMEQLRKGAGDE